MLFLNTKETIINQYPKQRTQTLLLYPVIQCKGIPNERVAKEKTLFLAFFPMILQFQRDSQVKNQNSFSVKER